MRVLVTGAAGFIGGWAVAELSKKGYEVIATDKVAAPSVITTDITELNEVLQLFDKSKPDSVIHLAAISGSTGKNEVEQSLRQPYSNFKVNVLGTTNICEACRLRGVNSLVYMSSFAVYGRTEPDRLPVTETTPVSLEHSYATSKYAGELVVRNYSTDFGFKSTIFRTPFIVGDHQKERNVVQEFIDAALTGKELKIFGDGEHVREFLHPSEVADAFSRTILYMNETSNKSELFVLGNKPISIKQLAEKVVQLVGKGVITFESVSLERTFDQYSDHSKAAKVLGWSPTLDVDRILKRVISDDFRQLQNDFA